MFHSHVSEYHRGSNEAYVFIRCREGSGGVKVARIHLRVQSKENQIGGVRGSTVVVLWTRVVRWISYRSSIFTVASTVCIYIYRLYYFYICLFADMML